MILWFYEVIIGMIGAFVSFFIIWWKLLSVIAPQLFSEEVVFTFKIINPNLEDRFYLLFQNLVCEDISV